MTYEWESQSGRPESHTQSAHTKKPTNGPTIARPEATYRGHLYCCPNCNSLIPQIEIAMGRAARRVQNVHATPPRSAANRHARPHALLLTCSQERVDSPALKVRVDCRVSTASLSISIFANCPGYYLIQYQNTFFRFCIRRSWRDRTTRTAWLAG